MLLQTVAVAKDISKKGMQANGKLITIFGYCQDISSQKIHLHFFVGNLNLLRNIDHWVLISLNFDAIHPKCAFVVFFVGVCVTQQAINREISSGPQFRAHPKISLRVNVVTVTICNLGLFSSLIFLFAMHVLIHIILS